MTALRAGDFRGAFLSVFSTADHLGYKFFLVPAVYGHVVAGWGSWTIALLGSGIYSVINIAWVYALARRLGGARPEARWAALLAAASNSLFYWSRHLVPYDMALCFALACLYVSVHPTPTWRQSLLAGWLGFLTFVTYNGYWAFVAAALTLHVLRAWPSWKSLVLRAVGGLVGLLGSFLLLLFVASVMQVDLWNGYVDFYGTIKQGEFSDGYLMVTDYLWLAERGSLLIWLVAAAGFFYAAWRRTGEGRARAWQWFAVLVTITLVLVLLSNVLEVFVVYGRLVRQLVPLLALLAAWGVAHWCEDAARPRPGRRALLILAGTRDGRGESFDAPPAGIPRDVSSERRRLDPDPLRTTRRRGHAASDAGEISHHQRSLFLADAGPRDPSAPRGAVLRPSPTPVPPLPV